MSSNSQIFLINCEFNCGKYVEKQSQAGFATSSAPYMKPLNLPKTVGRYCTNCVDRRFQALHLFSRDQQVFGIPAFPALPNHEGYRQG